MPEFTKARIWNTGIPLVLFQAKSHYKFCILFSPWFFVLKVVECGHIKIQTEINIYKPLKEQL